VDFVGPTVRLPSLRKLSLRKPEPNDFLVTPEFLRKVRFCCSPSFLACVSE
jgi:hypothetical protein